MPDPLFGAAFFVGILGNVLARHMDPAARSVAESIFARLSSGQADLPPNHDVERVCRSSLRQALELMAQTMDLFETHPKTLFAAIENRFDGNGRWKPMLEWWHTDETTWFKQFTQAIESDDAIAEFNLGWVKGATSLNDALRGIPNAALQTKFSDALLEWTARCVTAGKAPVFFDDWVRNGWPVAKDSPTIRISLFPAWCLFLQQHFKQDENVKAILTADWLASIDERLRNFPIDSQELTEELRQALGEQLQVLTELRDQVQQLAQSYTGLKDRTGQLFAIVLEFRSEVGVGFSKLREYLSETHAIVVSTHAEVVAVGVVVQASDEKLDDLLDKVDTLLAVRGRTETIVASPAVTFAKRIASSKLLDSDGAARVEQLVGRSTDKALLTRTWREGEVRVLSFVAWGGTGKTSLVIDWLKDRQDSNWKDIDAFFDWSFYSQGTRDQTSANSDAFFNAALRHFGDESVADSNRSGEEKALHLGATMAKQRTVIILDGLEPLQHPRKPGQIEGRLKDGGIAALLRTLAKSHQSVFCIITTRVPVVDLKPYHGRSVREVPLTHLSVRHGAELLHLAGAEFAGAAAIADDHPELLTVAKEVRGHAMTLQMLGGYLRRAQEGDIRRRDRVNWTKAFEGQLEGHAYNVMEAYAQWFQAEGARGHRQLAVLRMLGLFDRMADAGCISALRKESGVLGVSEAVANLSEDDWQETLSLLGDHQLISVNREDHSLDAHPLLREYFAQELQQAQPEAWRAGHKCLYDYLVASTPDKSHPTLEDLQPLYQAVAHGCQAGLHQETCDKVYYARTLRGNEHYSLGVLGAYASDLGAVACFFDTPWGKISTFLTDADQGWLLSAAATRMLALGRLTESIEPMQSAIAMRLKLADWGNAARSSHNLSQLEVTLGNVAAAVTDGAQSVAYADRSGEIFLQIITRSSYSDALHLSGRRNEAERLFHETEQMQKAMQPDNPLLYALQGFVYNDFLLAASERAAWQTALGCSSHPSLASAVESSQAVSRRAVQTCKWIEGDGHDLLGTAVERLMLGRAALYEALLLGREVRDAASDIEQAVFRLRRAGTAHLMPAVLLTRSLLRFLTGTRTGPDSAQADLDEAWEIAERGPMRLFMAEIHLYRARLFFREERYPWESSTADLTAARRLIDECGYERRRGELEDADSALRQYAHNPVTLL